MSLWINIKSTARLIIVALTISVLAIGQVPIAMADNPNNISGTLTDRAGNPIEGATLDFISSNGYEAQVLTDSSGNYSKNVTPDIYKLSIRGETSNNQFDLNAAESEEYSFNTIVGNVVQDLQLDTVSVGISFVNQNNQSITNAKVYGRSNNNGGDTSLLVGHTSVRYSGNDNTNPFYTAAPGGDTEITLLRGLTYDVCAIDPATNVHTCGEVTPTEDTAEFVLTALDHNVISGAITDRSGNAVSNMTLDFMSTDGDASQVYTNSAGNYSTNVNPDFYGLNVLGDTPEGSIDLKPHDSNKYVFNATSSNIIQDLQLDTVKVDVHFVDQNNLPIINAHVYGLGTHTGDVSGGSTSLIVGNPDIRYYGSYNTKPYITDNNGKATVTLLRGLTENLCAVNPATNEHVCTNFTPVNDESTVTLDQDGSLPAPTNLSANSPTNASNLTWNSVAGATSYNVYRNNTLIHTGESNTYKDSSAPSGNSTYHVTAIKSGTESEPSNIINVAIDSTTPTVVNVQQIWNTTKQRTEITLRFSDPVNGLPQGWNGSGTSYTKAFYNTKNSTVSFVDAVGNTGNMVVTPIGLQ